MSERNLIELLEMYEIDYKINWSRIYISKDTGSTQGSWWEDITDYTFEEIMNNIIQEANEVFYG